MYKKEVCNWGLYPKIEAEFIELSDYNQLSEKIKTAEPLIVRGNGRCYGDSSLQKTIVSTLKMNKFLVFDKENGILKCESGVLLSEILELIVPEGFFLPVTPGTKLITVGGAIGSNVHGKNHHKEGSFSEFVLDIEIITEDGQLVVCSPTENKELFLNTIGGMGATGIITAASFKLKKIETAYIKEKALKASNLNQIIDYFEKYNEYTYSVAWIDCVTKGKAMGRSILLLGEHATAAEANFSEKKILKVHSTKQINVPFYFPNFTLNKLTISMFNFLYYNKQLKREKNHIVYYDTFFYPLDKLKNWNRIYGKNGFTQYQFVIPFDNGREALNRIMTEITNSGYGSFLAVLKTFGERDKNASAMSFPMAGYTLALDFKITPKVFPILDKLDKIVMEYGGRLYLTKDSRMSKEMFAKTYPENVVSNKFSSLQHERLL